MTDNAEVMKATARLLNVHWFGCYPHTLNLVVKDGLYKVFECQEILRVLRELANHFRLSAKATLQLKTVQTNLKMKIPKLKRDCETRWSSTYERIKRYLAIAPAVQAVCSMPGIVVRLIIVGS